MKDENCIFCKLANGDIPTNSIYEDDEYFMEEFDKVDMNREIIHDGCKFYGRCPFRSEICKEKETKLKEISNGHFTSCHMV